MGLRFTYFCYDNYDASNTVSIIVFVNLWRNKASELLLLHILIGTLIETGQVTGLKALKLVWSLEIFRYSPLCIMQN